MRTLLAKVLQVKPEEVEDWQFVSSHELSIETEYDYDSKYPVIKGELFEPFYDVKVTGTHNKQVYLEELFSKLSEHIK